MPNRKRTAVADSEWIVTIKLVQGPDNVTIGDPIELHFADSWVKEHPPNVDWCIGRRMEEAIPAIRKLAAKAKRAAKKKVNA